ncbi:MAG: hypothetical protein RIQ80_574 [Actinomycetota bacterium]|jgi:hypothetical protein|uniref:Uncharacterized protein n=1 Tax=Candidatus Fonsibacter lacus TaxID=2576439 RepID=A0A966HJR1_9PROT|nr:hypothetical protein [Candidatus Fonsibacter lacus]NBP59967.1 hypothetical protein [Pseudomonadota bacterium]NBQ00288.1 hypothetical protein [Pseudomonadota bacterium]NBQ46683.1 hypothetical protein [Pseudomonadota bacterium]NBY89712.1 hypothetical protein [Candidatus Fonsibacter lacus]
MTHREKHNIESNCVSFNDDCYNETNSYQENVKAMDGLERKVITDAVSSVYKTGQSFINYLEQKLSIIKQNKGGSSNA